MVYEYVNVESIRHELWQPIGKFIDVLIRSAIPTKQVNRAGLYLCFKFLRGGGKLNFVLNVGPTMFTRDIQGKGDRRYVDPNPFVNILRVVLK
jgi:hypothetical protein